MPQPEKYSFPNKPEEQVDALQKMRHEGERWVNAWGSRWDRNVALVRGDLWPDKGSKPLFLANLISPTVRRKAGLLVESKPGIDIRPRRSGLGITADVLRKTITAIFDEQNQNMVWETLAYYLAAFGCGFWKVSYDPLADFGAGDITLRDVDPRLIVLDPTVRRATDLWEAQYIREESIVPYSWVQRMFPKTAKDVEPDVNITYDASNETHKISWYERMIERIRKQAGVRAEESAIPRVNIAQWWVADYSTDSEKNRIYPGGRRIFITGDDVILNPNSDPKDEKYGQANPHWDGLWPYVMLDNQPDLDHPFGLAEVESLRKMNEAFNNIGHTTTRTIARNIPWIIADQGSIDAQTLQDIKELEEMTVEKAPGRSVERMPPAQPSTLNVQFMQFMLTLIEMSSGLSDGALQGKGRVELRSAPQLEGLQQAAQVLIRAQARRFESMVERGGQLAVSRIFQYYTTDRILTYIDNSTVKDYEFQKEQLMKEIVSLAQKRAEEKARKETSDNLLEGMSLDKSLVQPVFGEKEIEEATRGAWKLFRFKVLPFSTLASTRIQRAQALEQFAAQMMLPQSMVLKEAGFDNWEELRAQALKEFQEGLAMGVPPPAPPPKSRAKKPA